MIDEHRKMRKRVKNVLSWSALVLLVLAVWLFNNQIRNELEKVECLIELKLAQRHYTCAPYIPINAAGFINIKGKEYINLYGGDIWECNIDGQNVDFWVPMR